MTATYTLSSIDHAVQIATRLTRSWFRGHARDVNALVPRVLRSHYQDEDYQIFRPDVERDLIEEFRRNAPVLSSGHQLPHEDDKLGWLCLMQHYRAPTRLLDWTESALVALWFAVSGEPQADGELWAMYPDSLNQHTSIGLFRPIPRMSPELRFLLDQPYWNGSPDGLAKEIGLKRPITTPIAFEPQRTFPRMIAQSSVFTIHPRPQAAKAIPDLLTDEKDLVRYIVPSSRKFRLYCDLHALGLSHATLFPDFEGLSRDLLDEASEAGYGPPTPPRCDGEYEQSSTRTDSIR